MTGTLVNTGAILAGSLIGMTAGKHLPERLKTIAMQGLGLSVMLVGLRMAMPEQGSLAAIACILLGALTGVLQHTAVIAVVSDKAQKAAHDGYRRIEQFQVGKRRVVILRLAD